MPTTLLKNPVNVNVTSTAVGLYVAGTAASPTSAGGAQPSNTLTIDGTTGQETTGSGETAGAGANVSITAGTGGAAPSGSTNGAGGSVTINPGAPGAGAGTASVYGNVLLATEGGNVGIGTTAAPGTGTKGLILGVGAALASMASDTCGFFGEDAGGTVHAFAISEAGVKMQLTGAADNTLATAVQDNITRLGTVTSGSFPAANLAGTTLASSVVTSSLTTVAALNAGSITSGFGSINVGADSITGGAANFTTGAFSGAVGVAGTTHLGSATMWPASTFAQTGTRVLITGSAEAVLILNNGDDSLAAGNASRITLGARYTAATNNSAFARILGGKENATSGNNASFLAFQTNQSAAVATERLRITSNGNILIGTTADAGAGSAGLVLSDGTALSSMGSNTCGLYGDDVTGTVHVFAISEAGATLQLTGAANNTLATAVQDNITRLGTVTSGSFPAANLAGTVNAASGGTGLSSYTTGDLLYASGAAALSTLADVAAGSYLRSGGVGAAPHWSTLKLPNAATANRIAYATSSNTYGESGNLTFNGTTLSVIGSFGVTGTGTANVNRTINVDTVDDGFTFTNQGTPSAGHVRYSPSLSLVGLARNPGGGGSTEAVTLRIYTKPVETAASPTGLLVFTGTSGTGTLVDMATLSTEGALSLPGGIQVGAPTGGDKGPGTVNVSGDYYRNGTAVFAQVDALLKKLDALTKRVGELESALTGTKAKRKSAEPKATKRTATKRTSRKEQR